MVLPPILLPLVPLLPLLTLADPAPPAVDESVVVRATRSAVTLDAERLREASSPALDDALRQVPGFSLFRRTGSRTANPTAQGVSLRGLAGSGASRARVLLDGVPLDDPFGGWVAWGRVPTGALRSVEVVRGAASDRYGGPALAGVIALVPRGPAEPAAAEIEAGSDGPRAALSAPVPAGGWTLRLDAEARASRGYVPVDEAFRGPVDVPADSRQAAALVAATSGRTFVRLASYAEDRVNGTPLQTNASWIHQLAAGWDGPRLALRGWAGLQRYEQAFTAVSPDRASETLVRAQAVPADDLGGTARWTAPGWSAVVEARRVTGRSEEAVPAAGGRTTTAGGRQELLGAYAERAGRRWTAGLRADGWRTGGRSDGAWSPRLSYRQPAGRAELTASAARAFRGPTLNELYRGFRVGDVVTAANPALGPETAVTAEVGLRAGALRAAAFWTALEDPILNVTVGRDGDTILRERRNLGETRTRGLEADLERAVGPRLLLAARLLLVDARITSAPGLPDLEGREVPQVAPVQGSLALSWRGDRARAAVQVRGTARAWEDDRNTLPLAGGALVDASGSVRLGRSLSLDAAVENLLDRRLPVGRTPVPTVGPPREARVGLRWVSPAS